MKDEEIAERIRRGDVRGLERLMDRYGGYVSTVIRRIVLPELSESDVEELAADAFTAVWRHPPEDGNIRRYLAAAARNRAIGRLRTVREELPFDEEFSLPEAGFEDETILAQVLESALDSMEPEDRELLVNTYYYCRPVKESAEALGISETAAKTRLFRARQKLKKFLTERGFEYEN